MATASGSTRLATETSTRRGSGTMQRDGTMSSSAMPPLRPTPKIIDTPERQTW
jgi:hypothetical protein